ncbi:ankyrin repeat protein nuc-2 [Pseudomassariella vexata]|uniref:Ankyrin repeat protein nuc-2 n=1 Tax=Pseudomassariella vexata TaxID=1141098 RepID=A0A1Y2DYL4_9PEZI|nr:ankyrin repeat protein nuc-2 [Pseudomassariella vexata]ORY64400.1 ankyrin repeat protein nuc-2 [Pseudomassariella vexata]
MLSGSWVFRYFSAIKQHGHWYTTLLGLPYLACRSSHRKHCFTKTLWASTITTCPRLQYYCLDQTLQFSTRLVERLPVTAVGVTYTERRHRRQGPYCSWAHLRITRPIRPYRRVSSYPPYRQSRGFYPNKAALTGSLLVLTPHYFGKQIQKRQLEVPEYAASFVNYKALKKLIKKLSATPILSAQNDPHCPATPVDSQAALQANRAKFFFQLERELEKVNAFYLQKEAELKVRLKTLLDKKRVLQSRRGVSRRSAKFATLQEGFQQFANDLNKLQQFVEINGTAFSKILKKWDKTSKSKTKELYLSRAVEVQPFFNAPVISELSDQATTSLQELGAWAEGDNVNFESRPEHIVSSQHLLGTDEGDADTLLLETAIFGYLESLRDLLSRMKAASESTTTMDNSLMERVTRTFLAAIHEAPQASLDVLLATDLVDIQSEDDINERNCLHQATIYGNSFVLNVGLSNGVAVNRTDVYGRVPLHYASMHGRLDMVDALLQADAATADLIDHDNFTPLIHAIIHGHIACVERILATSSRLDPKSDTDHVPLNLACEHGSVEIVELLLRNGAQILPDAEGLYPQHLVARSGQTPRLLMLLKQFGADLDQIDKLYGWTPLVHAASEGNVPCLQELLNIGANSNIVDEKDLPAMYYAAWEGHLECMKLLSPHQRDNKSSPMMTQGSAYLAPMDSSGPMPMSLDADTIPALELPPPIIPLRRYGHNFLDTKTVVQLSFEESGEQPLIFFHDSKYPAARLTISSKATDLIPKNIMLPFQEDTRLVLFQVEELDTFTLDFDVFPTYGAKIIAKTVALPDTFRASLRSSGRCCLPLFDPRLRAIGQISFNTQVIKPFQGAPLEITDFETYWKATSQDDQHTSMFVMGSSLSGEFVQVFVQCTSDGVPVLWPRWLLHCGGIEIPVARLSYEQFMTITAQSPSRAHLAAISSQPLENIAEIHRVLATAGVSLKDALALLPATMHVNIQILYPSEEEERSMGLGPTVDANNFVDAILAEVFDHARAQRAQVQAPEMVRSVVFSSYNPTLCTTLNWKQPNFPVFLCNDLGREETMPAPDVIQSSGRRTSSIKEAVRIAQNNNFMGLICCSRLLDMVPALVDAIKSQGLALVVDKSADKTLGAHPSADPLPKGIDGIVKNNGVLRFNESIDV